MKKLNVSVLVSGGGSNLEALLQAEQEGRLAAASIVQVISNRPNVKAIERAAKFHVPATVIDHTKFATDNDFQLALLKELQTHSTDIVCLAGFLRKIGDPIVRSYSGRILNIHPSLLPKYGGKGMYGHHVHEAVIDAQEKESGCTVHLVDSEYDRGPILAQAKVPVLPTDTPETLAARVLEQEHRLYPQAVATFSAQLLQEKPR